MALNDEVRIDESTSKRSQITGHLLIIMPKLNVNNAIKSVRDECAPLVTKVSKSKKAAEKKASGAVDIRNIIIDESEVPPLI